MGIVLDRYGETLRVRGQELLQDGKGLILKIPFHKVRRDVLSSGNCVSTSALFWLA